MEIRIKIKMKIKIKITSKSGKQFHWTNAARRLL
jgi:hypothetical protein